MLSLRNELGELCNYLVCRGYNRDFVEKEIERARRISRVDTLSNKQSAGNERIPFVVTFHPVLPNIGEILHRLHPILQSSSRCREAIGGAPMVAFRRPKCLKDILVHSELKTPVKDKGCVKCTCSPLAVVEGSYRRVHPWWPLEGRNVLRICIIGSLSNVVLLSLD